MAIVISNKSGSGSSITLKIPTVQIFTTVGSTTYTPPSSPAPLYLKMTLVGGGGGGSTSGTGGGGGATAGSATTVFSGASPILYAYPGQPGAYGANIGGLGGTTIVNTPGIAWATLDGQTGGGPQFNSSSANGLQGGDGGSTPFVGGGMATFNTSGSTATTNSGGGGAGGGAFANNNAYSGSGGGAGGYIVAIMPPASYTVTVGAGGAGEAAGAGGSAGGDGSSGRLIVEEFYQ